MDYFYGNFAELILSVMALKKRRLSVLEIVSAV
jgi:hypothetical protein